MFAHLYRRANVYLLLIAFLFSLIAYSKIFYWQTQVINPDGVCYLSSAAFFLKKQFSQAIQICPQAHWPFYSMLMAAISSVTTLPVFVSAIILQLIFLFMIYYGFLKLIVELGADKKTQIWGLAFIIFLPALIHVQDNIIRDHGFWAFYIISIYWFLKTLRHRTFFSAVNWGLCVLLASAFRIEGIFLFFAPVVVWMLPIKAMQKLKCFVTLYTASAIAVFSLMGYFLFFSHHSWVQALRWHDVVWQMAQGMQAALGQFSAMKARVIQDFLPSANQQDATIVLSSLFVFWYVVLCVTTFSWVVFGVFVLSLKERVFILTQSQRLGLASYILIHVGMTFIFLLQNHFLSQRYLTPLILIGAIWIPFLLAHYACVPHLPTWKKVLPSLLMSWLVLSALVPLLRFEKTIPVAGLWLKANALPMPMYTNDLRILYYAGIAPEKIYGEPNTIFFQIKNHPAWHQGQIVAWVIPSKNIHENTFLSSALLLKQFCYLRQCVNIYQIK